MKLRISLVSAFICVLVLSNYSYVSAQEIKFDMAFTKHVEVFGIHMYATPSVSDYKMLHSANVLAEYLDNDENGVPDNQLVMDALIKKKATVIMSIDNREWMLFNKDLHYLFPDGVYHNQYAVGALPNAVAENIMDGCWEEILHLITRHGYGNAYPSVFCPTKGTKVALAVDKARGGHFEDIPEQYPADCWYSYDDRSCGYGCQIDEYMYWALTSILGAQDYPGRLEEIGNEWKLNTKEKVIERDPLIYALLTDPKYNFPAVIPDGNYRNTTFAIEKILFKIQVQKENQFPPKGRYPATVNFVTECQAPGGEAIKISFTIADDNEHKGKSLSMTAHTVLTLDSKLFDIISTIRPELKNVKSVEGIDPKSIEGRRVWLTTEPMTGVSGSVFPKIVKIEME